MYKTKKKKITSVGKSFAPESEYGGKGGQAHATPTGPMKGNPAFYSKQVGVKPDDKLKKKLEKDSSDITDEVVAESADEDEKE